MSTLDLGSGMADMALQGATLLLVDDEANILSSLRRLFRSEGYRILTAESGRAGLEILQTEPVDLVISDMRMPEMDGAQFLEQVRRQWPDTIRLLLTGYADVASILRAINRGEIYRYITKPWVESDIILIVRQALERQQLEFERRRLENLTRLQNDQLRQLNAELEQRVIKRTAQLQNANDELAASNEKLRTNFLTSIKIFSNLIEMREKRLAGHSRRVADLARRIAKKMALPVNDIQEVFVAGLLHNIGKIGFSDELLGMPVSLMNTQDLALYRKYPVRGEQLLMPLEDLEVAAKIVRSHQERFDGSGYPDQLSGFDIPVGARIIALASDYDNLQIGALSRRSLRPEEAAAAIVEGKGKRYDPIVVKAFQSLLGSEAVEAVPSQALHPTQLKPGMVIAREVVASDGYMLLSAGHVLSERLIQQLIAYEESSQMGMTVYVQL